MNLSPLKSAALLVLALATTLAHSSSTFASPQGDGARRIVLHGVITSVAGTGAEALLTLDLKEADDDAGDDVMIQLNADTRVSPPGVLPAVGVKAHAVALAPVDEDGAYSALVLVLKGRPQPEKRPLQACGTISALPDGGTLGTWTVSVPDVADHQFTVNEQTRVSPPDVDPAVGMRACFLARSSAAGWVAQNVQLKPVRDREGGGDAKVGLNGIVTAMPLLPEGTWTLTVEAEGDVSYDVLVTPDTEIDGTLILGARVAIRATRSTDDAGVETLTAQKIKVVGQSLPGAGHRQTIVRVEGTVTAVSDAPAAWTITHEETDVVVLIGAETHIVGLASGQSAIGLEVEGKAIAQADGTLLARLLRVKRH